MFYNTRIYGKTKTKKIFKIALVSNISLSLTDLMGFFVLGHTGKAKFTLL
jgi:hypothetical protein